MMALAFPFTLDRLLLESHYTLARTFLMWARMLPRGSQREAQRQVSLAELMPMLIRGLILHPGGRRNGSFMLVGCRACW